MSIRATVPEMVVAPLEVSDLASMQLGLGSDYCV